MGSVILYGAGGHGKVVAEILSSNGMQVSQVWDDADVTPSMWDINVSKPLLKSNAQISLIITVGINSIRKIIANKLLGMDVEFMLAKHKKSIISDTAILGRGTVVMGNVCINADTIVGEHCIVNTNSSVDHDCILGNYVHVSPNAVLCGGVVVGEGTHVGAGATVIPNINIGKWATIGAGAVVIDDIPDYAVVVGNPGRVIKYSSDFDRG